MTQDPPSPAPAGHEPTRMDGMDLLLRVVHRMNRHYRSADVPPLVMPLRLIHIDDAQLSTVLAGEVKPGEPSRVYETRRGYTVSHARGLTLHEFDGTVTHLHLDGLIETTKPHLQRIDICDLREVLSYRIHRMLDADVPTSTSHVIHFVGGGFFSFLMDGNRKILETMERDVITSVNRHTGVLRLHGSRMPDDLQGTS